MPIKADLTHLLLVLKSIHQLHESANTPQSSQNGQFKFLLDIKWIGSQAMLKSWKTLKGNKTHVYKRRKALFWSNYQFSSHHYESPNIYQLLGILANVCKLWHFVCKYARQGQSWLKTPGSCSARKRKKNICNKNLHLTQNFFLGFFVNCPLKHERNVKRFEIKRVFSFTSLVYLE